MKKADVSPLQVIVAILILLIVAFLVIFVFQKHFGKESSIIGEKISQTKDSDNDGVVDIFDKCPNTKGILECDGCPKENGECQYNEK